jgi:hypothetical protein
MEGAMDLDEPADVYWTEETSPTIAGGAEKKKSCETIAEAVRFVMETLPEPLRAGAYIGADKDLDLDEIRAIYDSPEYAAFKA